MFLADSFGSDPLPYFLARPSHPFGDLCSLTYSRKYRSKISSNIQKLLNAESGMRRARHDSSMSAPRLNHTQLTRLGIESTGIDAGCRPVSGIIQSDKAFVIPTARMANDK
jgi:hypothetical protein